MPYTPKISNAADAFAFINYIENNYPVDTWLVDEVHVWPLIRIILYRDLLAKVESIGSLSVNKGSNYFLKRLKNSLASFYRFPLAFLEDFSKNAAVEENTKVVFLSNGVSFAKLQGKYFEKFCDPIQERLDSPTVRLDPTNIFYTPRYLPSKFIQPNIDKSIAKSILLAKRNKEASLALPKYEAFLEMLKGVEINSFIPSVDYLKKRVKKIEQIKKYFLQLFKDKPIKLGFMVCYYADYGLAFNLACKELSIPTIDIQHGVQGENHIAYGRWLKVPKGGYGVLPKYFWCWSMAEKIEIEKWSKDLGTHQGIVGGHPFLTIWNTESAITKHYTKVLEKILQKDRLTILVSLSNGAADQRHLENILAVIEKKQNDYNWLVRLHPGMLKEKDKIHTLLAENGIKNYNLSEASTVPLPPILQHTDIHITYNSSVTIEADNYNIPSIILSEYGASLYKEYLAQQQAIFAESTQEIEQALKHFIAAKKATQKESKIVQNQNVFNQGIQFINSIIDEVPL